MPDILIRMEMPRTCSQCPLCYDYMMCSLREGRFSHMGESFDCCEMRLADCPLIELPPHGDLIDRDALISEAKDPKYLWMYDLTDVPEFLGYVPVVVPEERRDADA